MSDAADEEGFKDRNHSEDYDYAYDVNGNMVKDLNKEIFNIEYNHLNLPTKVIFNTPGYQNREINYIYDATGVKLEKIVNTGNFSDGSTGTLGSITYTQYDNGFIYEYQGTANPELKFFAHAEGYVEPNGNNFVYIYQYKDHLGNIRLSYKNVSTINTPLLQIIEENNYYPFGLEHKGYNNVVNGTENNYQTYNGKELEEELGKNTLAYGWRDYDPAIGRFNKIDRFAEKYYNLSTYSYAGNNPIVFVDIQGDSIASGASTRKANRIERRAERRADRLQKKAEKKMRNYEYIGEDLERIAELRQSAQDVRDMRSDENNMYRYKSVNSKEAKDNEIIGPSTTPTGTTESGLNEITLYTESSMGSQLHETRHGGQTARGELGSNYGVADEVSAYRAEYSWNSRLSFLDVNKTPSQAEILRSLQSGENPLKTTLKNINSITPTIINSMVDPGFKKIYPPRDPITGALLIPLNTWNSN